MSKQSKGKDGGKDSPETKALNELGRKLMKVPKKTIEQRGSEYQMRKGKRACLMTKA
jgi:hypothetical protein